MDENETAVEERKILSEYESLAEENPDFIGWISIEGTRIDYPVIQAICNREYYLHRKFPVRNDCRVLLSDLSVLLNVYLL